MKCQQLSSSLLRYKGESDDCPGGCSYYRQGDPLTVYCFGPGERNFNLECVATTTGEYGGKYFCELRLYAELQLPRLCLFWSKKKVSKKFG